MLEKPNNRRKKYTEFGYVNSDRNNATFIFNFFVQMILHMDKKFERISRKKVREMCKKDVKHQYLLLYLDFLFALRKIGTRGVRVSTARRSKMCYWLGTSVPGPPRGSVGPGAKYLFGGLDDVIMYSSGTRVY